ncbi:MAG: acetylglutamate kinase [Candidatus Aminicenantaceae bacterium]
MIILKIGGGKDININGIADDLARIKKQFIIVHGAHFLRKSFADKLQIPLKEINSISGYSSILSNKAIIDLQMMVYAGLQNKRIVEVMHQKGINALGVCGIDGSLIRGKRNKGIRVKNGNKLKLLKDLSGKPHDINKKLFNIFLQNQITPVLTIPILDENNTAINSENDDCVQIIQEKLHAEKVIYLIEAPGLLKDPSDSSSSITHISWLELEKWEAKAQGRIKRKLHAINKLLKSGTKEVIISDGRSEHPLSDSLKGKGTLIK